MESHDDAKAHAHMSHEMKSPYLKFWVSLAANALLMFVLMFVMINTIAEFIPNVNFVYVRTRSERRGKAVCEPHNH
ncbi:hypothetical protein [Asticcacaulis taihuensis]|uniref:hypothetical protein n=1 Tax=Asticcacaulis taihuensis TaxID=260084 RepID=UPI0026EC5063|nr:hypothetical protein [Asticcacaulis taihuensis]